MAKCRRDFGFSLSCPSCAHDVTHILTEEITYPVEIEGIEDSFDARILLAETEANYACEASELQRNVV